MATRRAVIETALLAERLHVWVDLTRDLTTGTSPISPLIVSYIARIRMMGESLGYPTDWREIPHEILSWYELVENCPELGLHPLPGFTVPDDAFEMNDVLRKVHGYTDDDPDNFDWGQDGS